jgi:hypothetical protein
VCAYVELLFAHNVVRQFLEVIVGYKFIYLFVVLIFVNYDESIAFSLHIIVFDICYIIYTDLLTTSRSRYIKIAYIHLMNVYSFNNTTTCCNNTDKY